MVDDVETALRQPSPFTLLALASGIVEASTPRPLDRVSGRERVLDATSLYASFAEGDPPAMGALALAIAALIPDELLAARIRRRVDLSTIPRVPRWLEALSEPTVTGTRLQTHPLGDGDNIMVAVRWRHGGDATAIVYVDHNMGTLVKDAFVVPEPMTTIEASYRRLGDRHMTFEAIAPADVRARADEAIRLTDITVPPIETDSWPACRPMVEWILRLLPLGGVGHERPELTDRERDQVLSRFMASPFAQVDGLSERQVADLADALVWFGCDYGTGDPLRWSPVSVEIVLMDWFRRKVQGLSDRVLRRVPDVVAAFVSFAQQERSVPDDLRFETLRAVDTWRRPFAAQVDRARHDVVDDDDDEPFDFDAYLPFAIEDLEQSLVELVGSRAAYDSLDDEPLDDVAFDFERVPPDVIEPTRETLELIDRWATELYDDEVRTIARAVLAAVAQTDPKVFTRSSRTDAVAASILAFLMARLTGRFSAKEKRQELAWRIFTQKELAEATGVRASSISSRSQSIGRIVERSDIEWPHLLHSSQRREVLRTRRVIADWRAGLAED